MFQFNVLKFISGSYSPYFKMALEMFSFNLKKMYHQACCSLHVKVPYVKKADGK